jgi:hypothetical protein
MYRPPEINKTPVGLGPFERRTFQRPGPAIDLSREAASRMTAGQSDAPLASAAPAAT